MEEKRTKKLRHFTEEFKQEAINLANQMGNVKAAKELGINEASIRYWKKKSLQGPTSSKLKGQGKKSYEDLEKEVRRLNKELGYFKEINKVLKKSTAIFSQDLMGGSK